MTATVGFAAPAELRRAHDRASSVARHTPTLSLASLAALCGGDIAVKAECLQRTGSFKLRGALAKLDAIGNARGVVTGSAGNHAQALAYAARVHGVPCDVFMPPGASRSKADAVAAFGATVRRGGATVDDCVRAARAFGEEHDLAFVHPFDDEAVITGQSGVGIELLDDVPDLSLIVVPVGGGGLAAGIAMAVRQRRPEVRVVGVQARACASVPRSLRAGGPQTVEPTPTIADGIAIKRPGDLTLGLIERWLDDVVTVGEDEIRAAMTLLLQRGKLVAEGAGAVATAALMSGAVRPASHGVTVAVISGGNVDADVLTRALQTDVVESDSSEDLGSELDNFGSNMRVSSSPTPCRRRAHVD
jgi:threonine dehydratase